MNENEQSVTQQENVEQDTNNYIEAIKEIKANSVSKEAYKKLQEENKKLLESLVAGETIKAPAPAEEKVDLNELRKRLETTESPIDYCKTSLKLHEETLKQTGINDYLPNGKKIRPTKEDEDCIDYADGDDQLFIQELQRRTYPGINGR